MLNLNRIRERRIARHDARAKVFGAACVAAMLNGDRRAAAEFHTQMCAAQAARDALIEARPSAFAQRVLGLLRLSSTT